LTTSGFDGANASISRMTATECQPIIDCVIQLLESQASLAKRSPMRRCLVCGDLSHRF
jgi:hypothetical protein